MKKKDSRADAGGGVGDWVDVMRETRASRGGLSCLCVTQRSLREEMKKKDSRAEGAGDAEGGLREKFFLIFSLPSA